MFGRGRSRASADGTRTLTFALLRGRSYSSAVGNARTSTIPSASSGVERPVSPDGNETFGDTSSGESPNSVLLVDRSVFVPSRRSVTPENSATYDAPRPDDKGTGRFACSMRFAASGHHSYVNVGRVTALVVLREVSHDIIVISFTGSIGVEHLTLAWAGSRTDDVDHRPSGDCIRYYRILWSTQAFWGQRDSSENGSGHPGRLVLDSALCGRPAA